MPDGNSYNNKELYIVEFLSFIESGMTRSDQDHSMQKARMLRVRCRCEYVNQHEVTGLVVPQRNPESLAEALNRLPDNDALRQEMGEAGHTRAKDEITLDYMWRKTLAVCREDNW